MKNKTNERKIIASAMACSIAVMLSCTAFASDRFYSLSDAADSISVFANGEIIKLTDNPFVKNGEVYIPVRELLNGTSKNSVITWNADRTLIIKNKYNSEILKKDIATEVYFAIDSNSYKIKDCEKNIIRDYKLQNPPLLVNSKTYIPYELIQAVDKDMRITNGVEIVVGDNAERQDMLKKSLTWANSLKTRDGKPRYEMMTEDMKKEFIELQKAYVGDEEWNYVIGYSSPWTLSSDILICDNNAYITYYQSDSTPEMYVYNEKISFEKSEDKLLVSGSEEIVSEDNSVCAYIRKIDGDKITLDVAEYIDSADSERIDELKLSEAQDFPNGYYIYNPDETTAEYSLSEDTLYTFVDWNREFTDKDADMFVSTNSIDTFKKYIESYEDAKPGMPFFFEFDGDRVLSVTENYMP